MDRNETRDFHTKLLSMRKERQTVGEDFTEENLKQRDKEQKGENDQQKYD